MSYLDELDRDIAEIRLETWGRVVPSDGVLPWSFVDPDGLAVVPVERFLRDFVARGRSRGSVRSYAYVLMRWWRFLRAVEVDWDRATSAEVRDLVLWLGQATKLRRYERTASSRTAGQVNAVTRKTHQGDRYGPATIRQNNAVLRTFYDFWIEAGEGPLVNPVVRERSNGHRANAHHNPLVPFRAEGRLRYNPKLPKRKPRAMSDERWNDFFAAMGSNRDRAILTVAVSTGARAAELLGIGSADLDWGDQLVRVRRKGSGAEQWLPASQEAFVWLRLYLDELGSLGPTESIWWTLRRRDRGAGSERQRLNYDALRAVLRRANHALGANWTMHDLRHTCAVRMTHDRRLSTRDIQTILGHANMATTQIYTEDDEAAVIARVREHLATRSDQQAAPPVVAAGYRADDLTVLLGGAQ